MNTVPATAADLDGFARAVQRMREAQREYFRTRLSGALCNAKRLEQKVDEAVDAILGRDKPPPEDPRQMDLFGGRQEDYQ